MTSVAASAIAIILGIAVFIILAYKGLAPFWPLWWPRSSSAVPVRAVR